MFKRHFNSFDPISVQIELDGKALLPEVFDIVVDDRDREWIVCDAIRPATEVINPLRSHRSYLILQPRKNSDYLIGDDIAHYQVAIAARLGNDGYEEIQSMRPVIYRNSASLFIQYRGIEMQIDLIALPTFIYVKQYDMEFDNWESAKAEIDQLQKTGKVKASLR